MQKIKFLSKAKNNAVFFKNDTLKTGLYSDCTGKQLSCLTLIRELHDAAVSKGIVIGRGRRQQIKNYTKLFFCNQVQELFSHFHSFL